MNDGADVRRRNGEYVECNGDGEEDEAMVELPVKVRRSWQEPTTIERETDSLQASCPVPCLV